MWPDLYITMTLAPSQDSIKFGVSPDKYSNACTYWHMFSAKRPLDLQDRVGARVLYEGPLVGSAHLATRQMASHPRLHRPGYHCLIENLSVWICRHAILCAGMPFWVQAGLVVIMQCSDIFIDQSSKQQGGRGLT